MQFWPDDRMIDTVELGYLKQSSKVLQLEQPDQFNNQIPIQMGHQLIIKGDGFIHIINLKDFSCESK